LIPTAATSPNTQPGDANQGHPHATNQVRHTDVSAATKERRRGWVGRAADGGGAKRVYLLAEV
jgi:hypothetical protein